MATGSDADCEPLLTPHVIVCCLRLTSEPLAARKFLVITHLKNLTELSAKAYLSLTELEVWLQGRLW